MINKIRDGKTIPYTNTGTTTIAAGTAIPVNDIVGVAITDIPAGEEGELATEGVFECTAAAGAWLQGEDLFCTTGGTFTTASTGNQLCAVAFKAKTTAALVGQVLLNRHS